MTPDIQNGGDNMTEEQHVSSEPRLIWASVFDPRQPGIFRKANKNGRVEYRTITCSCPDCPLLAAGKCEVLRPFGSCPYGRYRIETGPTGRANGCWDWIQERKKRSGDVTDNLGFPAKKMAFIGDYVYLPYAHMDMCKAVPFQRHSSGFCSGVCFIQKEAWAIDTVLTLIAYKPQALFGGEIVDYQRKSVPAFIAHIRECDPEMWSQLIAARPELDVAQNYIGRKALVRTLAHPITIPPKDSRYPVPWEWNGKTLVTTASNAYGDTWGGIKPESLRLEIVPSETAAVEVRDNAWVTPETVFVD